MLTMKSFEKICKPINEKEKQTKKIPEDIWWVIHPLFCKFFI
jgi:hypothetical protein